MKKHNPEDKKKFDELYMYIKKEIFGYDKQAIPKYMVLRLIGLKDGKFMANHSHKSLGEYDYLDILYTFKINKVKLKEIVSSSKYKDETHKFNTIMLIIEKEINDVVNRLRSAKKSEEKLKGMELENIYHQGAEYKNKSNQKELNEELKELW